MSDINGREYVTRSLFHDVSILSPVQEEEESFDSPRRRPTTRSALFPAARPYSPLPLLIIEVEKRVNKHDHPEEFYVRLERKMKRLYRKVFLQGRNVSSAESNDEDEYVDDNRSADRSYGNMDIDEEIHEGTGNKDNTEPVVLSDRRLKRRTTLDDVSRDSDDEEVKSKKSKSNDSSSTEVLPRSSSVQKFDDETIVSSMVEEDGFEIDEENTSETNYAQVHSFVEQESIDVSYNVESIDVSYNVERDDTETTSGSLDYIQVTCQAEVHRTCCSDEMGDEMDDEMDDESEGDSANQGVQDPDAADKEEEESLESNEGSSAPDEGDDVPTRGVQPVDVHEAGPAGEETSESLESDKVPDSNLLAPAPEREVELMRSPLLRPSLGSLPGHPGDSSPSEQLIDLEFHNRTPDETEDDDVIEERDQGTQTNFEETSPDGWGNIFVGQPRVFNLCHCRNHACD